jgi:hypothetical protein
MLPQPMNTSHAVPTLSTNNRLPSTAMPPPRRYAKRTRHAISANIRLNFPALSGAASRNNCFDETNVSKSRS